jgi:hypothetical protein
MSRRFAAFNLLFFLGFWGPTTSPAYAQVTVQEIIDTFGRQLEPPPVTGYANPPTATPVSPQPTVSSSPIKADKVQEGTFTGKLTAASQQAIGAYSEGLIRSMLGKMGVRVNALQVSMVSETPMILTVEQRQAKVLDVELVFEVTWSIVLFNQQQRGVNTSVWTFRCEPAVPDPQGPFHTAAHWTTHHYQGRGRDQLRHQEQVDATWTAEVLPRDRYNLVLVPDPKEELAVPGFKDLRPRWILTRMDTPSSRSGQTPPRPPVSPDPGDRTEATPVDAEGDGDVRLIGQGQHGAAVKSSLGPAEERDEAPGVEFFEDPAEPKSKRESPSSMKRLMPRVTRITGPPSSRTFFGDPVPVRGTDDDANVPGRDFEREER